jgi:Tol biopolymer transport system component
MLLGVVLAAILIGCSGTIALNPMWVPCPAFTLSNLLWSPDSTQIAYLKEDPTHSSVVLMVTDPISGRSTRLMGVSHAMLETDQEFIVPITWLPDSSSLLTAEEAAFYDFELFTMDSSGTKLALPEHMLSFPFEFQVSPDGSTIAVVDSLFGQPGTGDLTMLDRNGKLLWRLSENPSSTAQVWPGVAWSPDGTELAFIASFNIHQTLGIISVSGDNLQFFDAPDFYRIGSTQWSPDGNWIAFTAATDTETAFHVIQPDGSNMAMIVDEYPRGWRWLPDSSGFIYVAPSNEVVTINRDGTARTVLSGMLNLGAEAVVSPDATMIAYLYSGQYSADDLYVMNIDGTNMQHITNNPGNHKCLQWPF